VSYKAYCGKTAKEIFMKKTGIIAMILILVMITGSLTGCFTKMIWDDFVLFDVHNGLIASLFISVLTIPLDIVTSPIQITVWAINKDIERKRAERGNKLDGIDTFSGRKSIPKLDSLTRRISSLPEEKIVPFTETLGSFSKEEDSAMLEAFNNLSEKEIASSIEVLSLMSEERLIATLNGFQNVRKPENSIYY
jgi:hypothetical protein